MNMNKKILLFIIITLLSFCTFNNKVIAVTNECNRITEEEKCLYKDECKWVSATQSCEKTYVAEDPCDVDAVRRVVRFFGFLLSIAKVVIPLIIIGFGTFDLFKSVVDKDEKSLGKQLKMLGIRIVVFFVPNFIYAIFSLSDKFDIIEGDQYKTCAACLLDPTNEIDCKVEDRNLNN